MQNHLSKTRRAAAVAALALLGAIVAVAPSAAADPPAGYTLSIIAGNGSSGAPTAGPALNSALYYPAGVAVDSSGNVFIGNASRVLKVTPDGTLSVFAGTGVSSGTPTAGPATFSVVPRPQGLAIDANDNLYIADYTAHRILKVTPGGTLSIIAGTGSLAAPTPGPATSSALKFPAGVAVDSNGNIYVADKGNNLVEKITPGGTLSIIAGNGTRGVPTAGPALSSSLKDPFGVAVDSSGNVYIANQGNSTIEKVTPDGTLSTVAGTGTAGTPTAGPATSSNLNTPYDVEVDADNNLFILDSNNNLIEKVTPGGTLSIIAGTGTAYAPTAGPALSSNLSYPQGLALASNGDLYVTSTSAHRVLKVASPASVPAAPTSLVATAGNGSASIAFTAGADGGSAITKYQYRLGAGSWVDAGLALPIAITGLANYSTYSIQVRAVNAAGPGAASVAVTARPQSAGPTIGVAYSSGKQGAQVGFGFNRLADSTLVGFTVRAYAKGTTTVVSSCQTLPNGRSCYIPSLNSGTEYDIRVQGYFTLAGETKVRSSLESATSRVRVNS